MKMRFRSVPGAAAALTLLVLCTTNAATQEKGTPAAPGAATKASIAPTDRIDTLRRIRETGAVTLGVRETSVPFSFIDSRNQP